MRQRAWQAWAPVAAAGVLILLTGASALVYQVAWQRIMALHSGVGAHSVAIGVAAFLTGLGLGNRLGGRLSMRGSPRAALARFGLLELAIGVFGALSPVLYYDWLYPLASSLKSPSLASGTLHFAVLLPPTLLMGMSLPLCVRGLVHEARRAGTTVGYLYGFDLLGGALGAFAAPWLLMPLFGIRGAVLLAALGNALAGLGALALAAASGRPPAHEPELAPRPELPPGEAPGERPLALWLALYASSGFVALSLEIVWFRMLDVAVKSTAFTFGTLLAVYLAGTGLGCLVALPLASRVRRPLRAFLVCQCTLLALAALAVIGIVSAPPELELSQWYTRYWASHDFFHLGQAWDAVAVRRLYLVLPLWLFFLPTLVMGFAFVVLQRAVHDEAGSAGLKVGRLQAANVAGCVLGSLVTGLVGLELIGAPGMLRLLVALGTLFALVGWRVYGRGFALALAALALLAAALPGQERFWRRVHGLVGDQPVALVAEDATSVVALTQAPDRFWLYVNGKANSTLPYGGVHTVLGGLAAVLHPAPLDIAVVGLGSGDTAWAAACRKETRTLTVFEISAPQPGLLARLAGQAQLPDLRAFLADPRVRLRLADGRHALAADETLYDVIEADAIWPEAAYSNGLYSVEFFGLCASRLKAGGTMCTWAPTPRIRDTFRAVFPHVVEAYAGAFLVGSLTPFEHGPQQWRERAQAAEGYLGRGRVGQVLTALSTAQTAAPVSSGALQDLNRDLDPRDEFARARAAP